MGYINTVTYLDDNLLITLQKENNVRMFADIKHKTTTYSSTWYSLMSVLRGLSLWSSIMELFNIFWSMDYTSSNMLIQLVRLLQFSSSSHPAASHYIYKKTNNVW